MLHAIIQGKSSRWLKGAKKEALLSANKRIHTPKEDEITSTIFGVMKYLNAFDVYRFFRKLSKQSIPNDIQHVSHQIVFWERRKHKWTDNTERVTEPDMLVYFEVDGKKESYIVELKWGAYSHFGHDQLEREWACFQEGETHLIYLADMIHPDFYHKQKGLPWHALTWQQFLGIVSSECEHNHGSYALYMQDLSKLLNALKIKQFYAFSALKLPSDSEWQNSHFRIFDFTQINVPILNNTWRVTDEQ